MAPPPTYLPAEHTLFLADGKFDAEGNTLPQLFAGFAESPNRTLAIHFHGGLVSKQVGSVKAARLFAEVYGDVCYPVFFVWESGPLETLQLEFTRILQNETFTTLLSRVAQFVVSKMGLVSDTGPLATPDGAPPEAVLPPAPLPVIEAEMGKAALGEVPFAALDAPAGGDAFGTFSGDLTEREKAAMMAQLQQDAGLQQQASEITDSLAQSPVQAKDTTFMADDVLADMTRAVDATDGFALTGATLLRIIKGIVEVVGRVIHRKGTGRDHGIQATMIEETLREFYLDKVGGSIWETMKIETEDAFGSDPQCGGTAFVQALQAAYAADKGPTRLVLVSHSAGSIYICRLLEAFAEAGLPPEVKCDIVLLAAACTFDLLAEAVAKHADRIGSVRTFGMQDATERADHVLKGVPLVGSIPGLRDLYPGSLLYLVSGVAETEPDEPLVGMARYYDANVYPAADFPNIETVRQFFADRHTETVWSPAVPGVPGAQTDARAHEDFDNEPLTIASVKSLVQNPF